MPPGSTTPRRFPGGFCSISTAAGPIAFDMDGADEVDPGFHLIKGGGGALTRENVVAQASRRFLCLVDPGKQVPVLGDLGLPVEVIPLARSLVGRSLVAIGGEPEYRKNYVTDNGNLILDVWKLDYGDPAALESAINHIPGVVTDRLFAHCGADVVITGAGADIRTEPT